MEKFNCIIVEDEPLAAEVLQDYISQVPFLALIAICKDSIYALDVLQKERVDVIFLDIHLPRLKGLDFIRTLKKTPQVIVTTAYREYAFDGYELNVVDYLLKPVNFSRFLTAVNKLKSETPVPALVTPAGEFSGEKPHLLINVNKKKVKVYLDDILYIESRKEYISIVTPEKSYFTKYQLGEIEQQLKKDKFIRIHRSFIAAREKITAFGAAQVEIKNTKLPIGRSYREVVQKTLHRD